MDGGGAREGDEGSGDLAHHADCAAAVDERCVVLVEGAGEGAGGFEVDGGVARCGAAEDADYGAGSCRGEDGGGGGGCHGGGLGLVVGGVSWEVG